nr:hypothetical protein [Tanacetum cinerariifolium]GFA19345.1 hypothetical protein [Tanacetum cinerariifolium]GFA19366.1 hypothetical protein [Tanacetum cinerariifolium]
MTDYALWEVILNGDSSPPTRSVDGVEKAYPPTTVEEKLARKNELKDKSTQCNGLGYDWSDQAKDRPTNFALMAYTSSSSSNLDTKVSTWTKACLKSYETLKGHYDNLTKDFNKSKLNLGYHVVPPPYTRNFMPPKPDLVFVDEHVVSDTVTSLPSESKLKTVSEPIIKDLVSDSKDEKKVETKQIKPSFAK